MMYNWIKMHIKQYVLIIRFEFAQENKTDWLVRNNIPFRNFLQSLIIRTAIVNKELWSVVSFFHVIFSRSHIKFWT